MTNIYWENRIVLCVQQEFGHHLPIRSFVHRTYAPARVHHYTDMRMLGVVVYTNVKKADGMRDTYRYPTTSPRKGSTSNHKANASGG